MAGVTMPLHFDDASYDYTPLIEEIVDLKANWIALTLRFYQQDITASKIEIPDQGTRFWQRLESTIQTCRSKNLKVFVIPIVFLKDANKGDWRGNIKPNNIDQWFGYYRHMILRVAEICEDYGVEMLSVGSELSSMQTKKSRWNMLVEDTKSYYGGKLCYSVNWDAISSLSFHSSLDLVGISAYFPLTNVNDFDPKPAKLLKSWNNIKSDIKKQTAHISKPFFLSEVGYRSFDGAAFKPYEHSTDGDQDLKEQYDCFNAFLECWRNDKDLAGAFIYETYKYGKGLDLGYNFMGKPAEKLVREFLKSKLE